MNSANDEVIILESKPSRFPSEFVVLRGSALSPCLLAIAIAFIAFGAASWAESGKIHPTRVEYSNINRYQYVTSPGSGRVNMGIRSFQDEAGVVHSQGSVARMLINVVEPLNPPVYMYYTVTNFYQAMSFWHDGRSNEQLMGSLPVDSMLYRCDPFRQPGYLDGSLQTPISIDGGNTTIGAMLYYPCGVAAWSKFNDSFLLYRVASGNTFSLPVNPTDPLDTTQLVLICNTSDFDAKGNPLNRSSSPNLCSKQGIARRQDPKTRFGAIHHDPFSWSPRYPYATNNRYLKQGWYNREPGHELPDPEDLDLQVWMASAATRDFRKLFRIINVPIPVGLYLLEVHEFFDSIGFQGSKGMILRSANSWIIEQHYPLAGCFLGIGCFAFVCSLAVGFNAFLNSRKDRREIAKQEAEDKAEMANVVASSTPISFIRASAKRMFNTFASFVGEEDHKKTELQRKRWYSFELNSPEMIEYLELRREREDIRKWQLENEGKSGSSSSSGSESSDQDIEEIGSTSFSPKKSAREESVADNENPQDNNRNHCTATVCSVSEQRKGVNNHEGVEMVEAEVDDSDEGEEEEVDEGEEEEPEESEGRDERHS